MPLFTCMDVPQVTPISSPHSTRHDPLLRSPVVPDLVRTITPRIGNRTSLPLTLRKRPGKVVKYNCRELVGKNEKQGILNRNKGVNSLDGLPSRVPPGENTNYA